MLAFYLRGGCRAPRSERAAVLVAAVGTVVADRARDSAARLEPVHKTAVGFKLKYNANGLLR